MNPREPKQLPPNWPFDTAEEFAEHAQLQSRGYALLRQANQLHQDAYQRLREKRAREGVQP